MTRRGRAVDWNDVVGVAAAVAAASRGGLAAAAAAGQQAAVMNWTGRCWKCRKEAFVICGIVSHKPNQQTD